MNERSDGHDGRAELSWYLPRCPWASVDTLVSLALEAEGHGYDRLWLSDTWGRDVIVPLSVIASATDHVGIGSSIVNVFTRSPTVLGQTAVTLQEVSDGRFRLGIGAGEPTLIEDWHGLDYEASLRRTREYTELIRLVISGETLESYESQFFDFGGYRLRCDPPSNPPAIDVAAMGPKMFELAGRFADGVHGAMLTPAAFRQRRERFMEGRSMASTEFGSSKLTLSYICCALSDGQRARDLCRKQIAAWIGELGTFGRNVIAEQGFESQANAIYDEWSTGEPERAIELVDDTLMDALAAAGTPDRVRAKLDAVLTIDGLDCLALYPPAGVSRYEMEETLEHIAP